MTAPTVTPRPCGPALYPDGSRTVLRPFHIADPLHEAEPGGRSQRIVERILSLSAAEVADELARALAALDGRHYGAAAVIDDRFAELAPVLAGRPVDPARARLIGVYFSEEYSVESAALFNPSVVAHPDQAGLAAGDTRFILSLRGIGEGHISSLLFRTGVWHAGGSVTIDPRGHRAAGPHATLPAIDSGERVATLTFPDVPLADRVIYPFLPSQGRGIEDARFCRFVEDDGRVDYRATFTAFDGTDVRQAVFTTDDFRTFRGRRLDGDLAFRKGAAWFPRRVGGRYAMLARLDEESICVLSSDDPDCWTGGTAVVRPRFAWEFVQMGNCGSPIELDEGWLVLTHGVGPARRYCIGAALLDRDDPTRLLARTAAPVLAPVAGERGGYVPNVVYTCGALLRDRQLFLPYGVADTYTAFTTLAVDDLLAAMA